MPAMPTPDESSKLLAEGRRKRAERRLRNVDDDEEDLLEDEPFPWLLVVAGAAAALVIVLGLSFVFKQGNVEQGPITPAPDTTDSKPAEASPARKLADEILDKAHRCESASDYEAAYAAVELPPGSPIRDDEKINAEVGKERERLWRKRQLHRGREAVRRGDGLEALNALRGISEGPDYDEAQRLRADAERLVKATPAPQVQPQAPPSIRPKWIQVAAHALGASDEDDLQTKRKAADVAGASVIDIFRPGTLRHACYEDKEAKFKGHMCLGGNLTSKISNEASPRGHRFMIFAEPGKSQVSFEAAPEIKAYKRLAVVVFGKALAPEEVKDLTCGLLKVSVNEAPAGEIVLANDNIDDPRGVDVTEKWQTSKSNKVVVSLGEGPSPVWIETIEVLALE
jgi:hypothetical protein